LDHIVALWGILMEAHRELDPVLYDTKPNAHDTWRAFARRQMGRRDALFLVASDDRPGVGVVGYLLGTIGQRAPVYSVHHIGMIYDVVVSPADRRNGIGEQLVNSAKDWFLDRGVRHLQVNFDPRNPSSSGFWPKMGFETLMAEAYLDI
jgi:GNAT superfamily N-acetyltransferase